MRARVTDNRSVLVVSPDELTRAELSGTLRGAGYDVREAASATDALALARHLPSLVLLDVGVSGFDGFELSRRLKADPRTARLPLVQTSSAFASAEARAVGLGSGAEVCLMHPAAPGELVAVIGALLRATEAETSVVEAGTEWQLTFDAIAEAVAILRADGAILRTNVALRALLNVGPADVTGRSVRAVFSECLDVDDPVLDLSREGAHSRRTSDVRIGKSCYRLVTDPILDERGHAGRFVLVMTDITSLRGLAEAERRRADELLEDKRRKDEFLAMLAHELRNPLNAIATATALLERDAPDQGQSRIGSTIARQVTQLSRIVDDLLDVSRLTRGQVQLQKEATDLKTVLHEAVQTARPYIDAQRQPLILDMPEESVPIVGDSIRLGQALTNLIANASKFSGASRRILLRCEIDRQDDAHPVAIVRVVDEGIGVDPSRLESIFEPFVQGPTGLARSEAGLGIGLTIARRMVELHDGEVTAHSAGPGTGTEFRVVLPLASVRQPHVPPPSAIDGYLREYRPPSLLDVLIVEDDEDAAELMRALFAAVGHRARVARDGISGLAEVLAHPPDVAFIDIGLPRMDGYEVARTIRRSDQGSDVFLVALTGYGRPEDRARALDAGFDVHLVKPLEIRRLTELMEHRPSRTPIGDSAPESSRPH